MNSIRQQVMKSVMRQVDGWYLRVYVDRLIPDKVWNQVWDQLSSQVDIQVGPQAEEKVWKKIYEVS